MADSKAVGAPKVLLAVYRREDILTTAVQRASDGVKVEFTFPAYLRTIRPINHVSAVQIGAALIEGAYCALEDAWSAGGLAGHTSAEWFYTTANDWLVRRQTVTYIDQVIAGAPVALAFHLVRVVNRKNFLWATVSFDGFCRGTTTWVLPQR